jgi:hypothetical protein
MENELALPRPPPHDRPGPETIESPRLRVEALDIDDEVLVLVLRSDFVLRTHFGCLFDNLLAILYVHI